MEESARAARVPAPSAAIRASAGVGIAAAALCGVLSVLAPDRWSGPGFSAPAAAGLATALYELWRQWLLPSRAGRARSAAVAASARSLRQDGRTAEADSPGRGPAAIRTYCEILKRQIGESIQNTAAMAGAVLRSLESTRAKVDELKETAVQNRQRALEVGQRLHSALASHCETRERVKPLVAAIGQLARKSTLIAINAAIEAARAGPAGAGFAILADELRALALEITETARTVETELGAMAETAIQEREGLAALVGSMQDVSGILISSAELVSAASLDALGQLQLQDVVRQQLEHVQSELSRLAADMHEAGASRQNEKLEQRLASVYQAYVMESQRVVHDEVLGRAADSCGAPAIELF